MSKVYLSLGSNLGDRKLNLRYAINEIGLRCGEVDSCSSFYSTSPWGFNSDNEFINIALSLRTDLDPLNLLEILQQIERDAGRQQKTRHDYEDRSLDIDILFCDDAVIDTQQLSIPHPRLHLRLFVLVPLAEIAPQLVHPIFQKTVTALLDKCPDRSSVSKV